MSVVTLAGVFHQVNAEFSRRIEALIAAEEVGEGLADAEAAVDEIRARHERLRGQIAAASASSLDELRAKAGVWMAFWGDEQHDDPLAVSIMRDLVRPSA